MEPTPSQLALVVCTMIVLLGVTSASDTHMCQSGEYYNRRQAACVPCSLCGYDKPLALRACYNDKDTLCGQWRGFQFRINQTPLAEGDAVADESQIKNTPKADEIVDVTEGGKQAAATPVLVANDDGNNLWFVITMVLVGILVLLCLSVMILLFVWCFVCRRKEREMVIDPVFTSTLLRSDDQGNVRKVEQFKLITET